MRGRPDYAGVMDEPETPAPECARIVARSDLADADRLPVRPTTVHRDYILTEYAPRVDPTGRLHSATLLRYALRREGLADRFWPIAEGLKVWLGPDKTVWGFKHGPAGFAVELYFYNFVANAAGKNRASTTALAEVMRPWMTVEGGVDESLPYFMCSVEVSAAVLDSGRAPPWRVYLATGDVHRPPTGFSYRAEAPDRYVAENHYCFYKAGNANELEDAVRRVKATPRTRSPDAEDALIPAFLRECHTVCYAVKPNHDGLYYSRIGSEQLVRFLRSRRLGTQYADLLEAEASGFAAVRWDLGFDFSASHGSAGIDVRKYAVHGVF